MGADAPYSHGKPCLDNIPKEFQSKVPNRRDPGEKDTEAGVRAADDKTQPDPAPPQEPLAKKAGCRFFTAGMCNKPNCSWSHDADALVKCTCDRARCKFWHGDPMTIGELAERAAKAARNKLERAKEKSGVKLDPKTLSGLTTKEALGRAAEGDCSTSSSRSSSPEPQPSAKMSEPTRRTGKQEPSRPQRRSASSRSQEPQAPTEAKADTQSAKIPSTQKRANYTEWRGTPAAPQAGNTALSDQTTVAGACKSPSA